MVTENGRRNCITKLQTVLNTSIEKNIEDNASFKGLKISVLLCFSLLRSSKNKQLPRFLNIL